ncbi:YhgE/Pip family protein [Gordonia phosphorivorans]|uniref:YhgE/Pip family protein n=1 Tax=Gordonia phosphorivorans TaxID=1056982 RepID=A0ABV6H9R2_9ACTN
MLAGMSLGTELKRYSKGVMPRVAIVTIVLLPLLYGAMYLWVFWNPFDDVNKMPVALVNEDTGAQVQGERLAAGDEVVANLKASGQLDLRSVDAAEAADGLAHGRYYFTITIPQDFSSAIASATGSDPHKATVEFTFNDANNYLATVIGNNAAAQVTAALNEKIGEQAVDQVLVGLQSAGGGLVEAADGARQLADGLGTANAGAQRLSQGADELAANMGTAREGAAQLAAGNAQLADGIAAATAPLLPLLDQASSLSTSAASAAELARVAGQVADLLEPVHGVLVRAGVDPALTSELGQLAGQARSLSNQMGGANGSSSLLAQLQSGDLSQKVEQLRSGAAQLKTGSAALSDGLVQLSDGSDQLAQGAGQLAAGLPQLDDGANRLATGLADGVSAIPDFGDAAQRQDVAGNLSTPVALREVTHNPAPTFGVGFAPFFLTLALFIGAMIIWMLIKPLQPRPVIAGVGGLRAVLWSYWPAFLIAAAQVLVMFVVAQFAVGLNAAHAVGLVAFMLLISAAFLAVMQMFNVILGVAVGRVMSLAFLMVQIVASGGIYPVPTTATPAQVLHPWDPMSYAVTGMRQMISGGVDSRFWVAVAVLAGLLVVSLVISAWGARRNRQYTMVQLFPPIQV